MITAPLPSNPKYTISKCGRVFGPSGREIKGWICGGYRRVRLYKDGKRQADRDVHNLVAETFLGVKPEGLETRHLDGVKTNCDVGNLKYGTHTENGLDTVRHGDHPEANKTECKHGHAFDETNTAWYLRPETGRWRRQCKQCKYNRKRIKLGWDIDMSYTDISAWAGEE